MGDIYGVDNRNAVLVWKLDGHEAKLPEKQTFLETTV